MFPHVFISSYFSQVFTQVLTHVFIFSFLDGSFLPFLYQFSCQIWHQFSSFNPTNISVSFLVILFFIFVVSFCVIFCVIFCLTLITFWSHSFPHVLCVDT
eukprot:Trichotokara_eunicae@DN6342_c0_g1_i3.p2